MTESNQERRRKALVDLLRLRVPIMSAVASVKELPWDSAEDLATLTVADVVRLLEQYLAGRLTAEQVEAWADAVEAREDVGVAGGDEQLLERFVFETANPELAEPISLAYARRWLDAFATHAAAGERS